MTMMSICARHELIPAVPHAAFSSTESHYAHGNVFLIGKCLKIVRMVYSSGVLVVKSINAIAARWPLLAQSNASSVTTSVPLEIISMHSNLTPSISAGEKFDCLRFISSNLLFNT